MDKDTALEVVARFGKAVEAQGVKPLKIVLFGSYSTGTHHEWSDIDLVVVSEDFADKGFWERIEILSVAICELLEPIEAVAMTPEEWEKGDSLIAQFARQGEVVYAG